MSATYGKIQGFNKDGEPTQGQRTVRGHSAVVATVQTWDTFATVTIKANGAGSVVVKRKIKGGDTEVQIEAWGWPKE